MPKSEPIETRFWKKVKKTESCWIWTGRKVWGGYGMFDISRKSPIPAHRASWIIKNGEIQGKFDVCHSCDVRDCVNPAHLFLGTRSENIKDSFNKGRIRRDGIFNPNHKNYRPTGRTALCHASWKPSSKSNMERSPQFLTR